MSGDIAAWRVRSYAGTRCGLETYHCHCFVLMVMKKSQSFPHLCTGGNPICQEAYVFIPYFERFRMLPQGTWMKPNVCMGFWRFVLPNVITWLGLERAYTRLRISMHKLGTISTYDRECLSVDTQLGLRIAGHKYAGIENLDKWPNLKVCSSRGVRLDRAH
jgi:hypothetical protein